MHTQQVHQETDSPLQRACDGTEGAGRVVFLLSFLLPEVSRNDSCPDLPEIQNGWKTTSHIALVRGARITYQCDPGYDLVGWETLTCQLDLSWSSQPPFCEKSEFSWHFHCTWSEPGCLHSRRSHHTMWILCDSAFSLSSFSVVFILVMYCSDPGHVEHSTRSLSDPKLLVGTTIQYSCNAGFILQGSATITCYGREPGTPVWTSRLPHCVCESLAVQFSFQCKKKTWEIRGFQENPVVFHQACVLRGTWALPALWFQKAVIRIDSCTWQLTEDERLVVCCCVI